MNSPSNNTSPLIFSPCVHAIDLWLRPILHVCVILMLVRGERSQQEGLEQVVADAREKRRRLDATKITGDTNAERVQQLRDLCVKVPGSGTGENLEGAKEVCSGKEAVCVKAECQMIGRSRI